MRNLLYKKEQYPKLPIKRKKEKREDLSIYLFFYPRENSHRVVFYQWKLSYTTHTWNYGTYKVESDMQIEIGPIVMLMFSDTLLSLYVPYFFIYKE